MCQKEQAWTGNREGPRDRGKVGRVEMLEMKPEMWSQEMEWLLF